MNLNYYILASPPLSDPELENYSMPVYVDSCKIFFCSDFPYFQLTIGETSLLYITYIWPDHVVRIIFPIYFQID